LGEDAFGLLETAEALLLFGSLDLTPNQMLLLVLGGADFGAEHFVLDANGNDLLLFVEELETVPAADLLADRQLWVSIFLRFLYNVDQCFLALFVDHFGYGLVLFKPHTFLF
jgi:hypothetical protein